MNTILSNATSITLQRDPGRPPSRATGKLASLSSGIRIQATADELAEQLNQDQVRARVRRAPARTLAVEATML